MRTRTRVVGIAIAVTAAGALVSSTASMGVPVEWRSHTAAVSDPATAVATAASPQTSTRPAASKPPKGSLPAQSAIGELRRTASAVTLSPQGTVTAVSGAKLSASGADSFVHKYAAAFGLTDAHGLARVSSEKLGDDTVTRYAQTAGGLPVYGGEIVVTARGSSVRSALATTSVQPSTGKAAVSAAAAGPIALKAAADKLKLTGLHVTATKQWQYDPAVIGAPGSAGLRPTWQVQLGDGSGEAASVLVDAADGSVRLTLSEREEARDRVVCDLDSVRVDLNNRFNYACPTSPFLSPVKRTEGGSATGVAAIDTAYDLLGEVYAYYRDNLNLDSYDNRGAQIKATVRACDLDYPGFQTCFPYPNAFWEGTQFVFGDGYATDDVVAHEFTHAVTEYSSHLIYAYQAGAINESVSDIIGELFDQSFTGSGETEQPWLVGEELPGGAIRSMSDPNAFGQPSCYLCNFWYTDSGDNGGVHINSGVGNHAAYKIAGQIGNAESLQLWWRVMHLLPAGANYGTLAGALQNACIQLVGFHGVTTADCGKVRDVALTLYDQIAYTEGWNACPNHRPADVLYAEGFERSAGWKLSSTQWLRLPADNAPYQFANSGQSAMNGWITSQGTGNGATAMLPTLALPSTSAGPIYVTFARAALAQSPATNVYLEMNVNGTGWKATNFASRSASTYPVSVAGADYDYLWADIGSSLAGKSVQFRFRLSGTNFFDFYVDDFRVYQCVNKPTAPRAAAYLTGTTATISVLTTYSSTPPNIASQTSGYLPSGQTIAKYEYVFIPPIPGAPTSSTTPTITIPSVAPGTYHVNIRAVTNTGVASAWFGHRLSNVPPRNCQSPAYPIGWTLGTRPTPCAVLRIPH